VKLGLISAILPDLELDGVLQLAGTFLRIYIPCVNGGGEPHA
jgi:hypothetical protein